MRLMKRFFYKLFWLLLLCLGAYILLLAFITQSLWYALISFALIFLVDRIGKPLLLERYNARKKAHEELLAKKRAAAQAAKMAKAEKAPEPAQTAQAMRATRSAKTSKTARTTHATKKKASKQTASKEQE